MFKLLLDPVVPYILGRPAAPNPSGWIILADVDFQGLAMAGSLYATLSRRPRRAACAGARPRLTVDERPRIMSWTILPWLTMAYYTTKRRSIDLIPDYFPATNP
jgi:hypothetical protein